jgi:SHS2 domain-containing protein
MAFERFDHTADVGLLVTAPTVEELFEEAGRALTSLIVDNPDAIELRETTTIELEAGSVEELFVLWLQELIYRFEVEHRLFGKFSVRMADEHWRLQAECRGERADWTRHEPDTEVKGVTYHQLEVSRTETGWRARVILDI